MSRLAQLVAEHCPDGAEVKALGEVGTFVRGSGLQKKDFVEAGVGCIHYGEIYKHYGTTAAETRSFVAPETAANLRSASPGDLIITTTSENEADVCKAVAWLGEGDIAFGGHSCVFRHELDPTYAAYCFQSAAFQEEKRKLVWGTKVKDIKATDLATVRIPVPPLPVQVEIARVLELFAKLRAELEQELRARKRQRVEHQHQLPMLSRIRALSPAGPERVPIGSIATQYIKPLRVQPDETYVNLGVRWYGEGAFARPPKSGSDIKGTTLYRVKPGQFVYNRMFVTEGSFGLITPDLAHGVVSNEFPVYDLDETRVLPEWLYLKFQDVATVAAAATETTGGTKSRRRWKEEQFEAFEVDLPSLAAQREIVRVINSFTTLETALTAELSARQKQFEHYLNRLMDWETRT